MYNAAKRYSWKRVSIYLKTAESGCQQTFEKLIRSIRIERVILYQFNKHLYSRCHKSVINHSRVAFELLFRSYPRDGCIRSNTPPATHRLRRERTCEAILVFKEASSIWNFVFGYSNRLPCKTGPP